MSKSIQEYDISELPQHPLWPLIFWGIQLSTIYVLLDVFTFNTGATPCIGDISKKVNFSDFSPIFCGAWSYFLAICFIVVWIAAIAANSTRRKEELSVQNKKHFLSYFKRFYLLIALLFFESYHNWALQKDNHHQLARPVRAIFTDDKYLDGNEIIDGIKWPKETYVKTYSMYQLFTLLEGGEVLDGYWPKRTLFEVTNGVPFRIVTNSKPFHYLGHDFPKTSRIQIEIEKNSLKIRNQESFLFSKEVLPKRSVLEFEFDTKKLINIKDLSNNYISPKD